MNRTLVDRTYAGEVPRPTVEVTQKDRFLMASTPWGNKDALREVTAAYDEFLVASMADHEATSPFAKITSLSPLANSLRAATLYANEKTFKKCNVDAYTSGCETLALAFEKSEIAWIQVGQPHLFLIRDAELVPLQMAMDLSVDYRVTTPLPGRLLGIDPQIDVEVKSMTLDSDDKLVMLARSTAPAGLFAQNLDGSPQEILDRLFNAVASADSKIPFWLSILS